jgi:hypothetical protein
VLNGTEPIDVIFSTVAEPDLCALDSADYTGGEDNKIQYDADENECPALWRCISIQEHSERNDEQFPQAVDNDIVRNGRPHERGKNSIGGRWNAQRRIHHEHVHDACTRVESKGNDAQKHRRVGKPLALRFPAHEALGDESSEQSPEKTDESEPDNAQGPELRDSAVEPENNGRERDCNKVSAEPLESNWRRRTPQLAAGY